MRKMSGGWRFCCLLVLFILVNLGFSINAEIRAQHEHGSPLQHPPLPFTPIRNNTRPNIIIILIDDMGFNDVSFHGSNQILTPNIDALAYNGIILNKLYVPNLCTPSRATLLTGKYPIHTGTQHYVIVNDEPWSLPAKEVLMPEVFRHYGGYKTHLIGKWHLGFHRKDITPTFRGFDHHYGYYSGYIDYYDHTLKMLNRNYSAGLDFRRDLKPWPKANGIYATDEFTNEANRVIMEHDTKNPLFLVMSHLAVHTGNEDNPMQAPPEEVAKFKHIQNQQRRTYAGMMSRLDKSVGQTIKALSAKGMLRNSVVLLYSDNGAPTQGIHANGGSNYPFRGQKESPWEGGIRSAGLIWSPLLKEKNYVSQQVMHSIDVFPTLASIANVTIPKNLNLDGVDMWKALSEKEEPTPRALLHSLDDVFHYSSYTRQNWKYIKGTTFNGSYDYWLGDLPENEIDPQTSQYGKLILNSQVHLAAGDPSLDTDKIQSLRAAATNRCPPVPNDPSNKIFECKPLEGPCLFDIVKDPCERFNIAKIHPLQVKIMEKEIDQYRLCAEPVARVPFSDAKSNPAFFGNNWEWWVKSKAPSIGIGCKNGLYHIIFSISAIILLYLL